MLFRSAVKVDDEKSVENSKNKCGAAENAENSSDSKLNIRITSDKLKLPNYMCGFYGCSKYGLVLVTLPDENNSRLSPPPFRPRSGDLISVKTKTPDSLPVDEKSGALIVKL